MISRVTSPESPQTVTGFWSSSLCAKMRNAWDSFMFWARGPIEVEPMRSKISPYDNLMEYAKCPVLLTTIVVASKVFPCGHCFEESTLAQVSKCPIDRGDIEKTERDEEVQAWLAKVAEVASDDLETIAALQKEIEEIQTRRARQIQQARSEEERALEKSLENVGNNPGLYLLATCTNDACEKVRQECWNYQGTGLFDMTEVCVKAECPSCNQTYDDVNTAAMRGASFQWHGRMATGMRKEETHTNANAKWVLFSKLSEWRYISAKIES